jgi:hypothetical protein
MRSPQTWFEIRIPAAVRDKDIHPAILAKKFEYSRTFSDLAVDAER